MQDPIERQDAIDEISQYASIWMEYDDTMSLEEVAEAALKAAKRTMVHILEELPSIQPEVIHCEDCAKCQIDSIYHDYWCNGQKVWKTHYCGYAERRKYE